MQPSIQLLGKTHSFLIELLVHVHQYAPEAAKELATAFLTIPVRQLGLEIYLKSRLRQPSVICLL